MYSLKIIFKIGKKNYMTDWRIEYCERPLKPSRVRDFISSEKRSHGFLRVINNNDECVLELHGLFSGAIGASFNTAAELIVGRPLHLSHLRVLALTNSRLMKIYTAGLPVTCSFSLTTNEDAALRYIDAMLRTGKIIQTKGLDYYINLRDRVEDGIEEHDPGLNCKTVATELLRPFVDLLKVRGSHFENPTKRVDLTTVDPMLSNIHVDWDSTIDVIRLRVAEGVRELSPKHGKWHLLRSDHLSEKLYGTLEWLRPKRFWKKRGYCPSAASPAQ
jgi:hypothetical protein